MVPVFDPAGLLVHRVYSAPGAGISSPSMREAIYPNQAISTVSYFRKRPGLLQRFGPEKARHGGFHRGQPGGSGPGGPAGLGG